MSSKTRNILLEVFVGLVVVGVFFQVATEFIGRMFAVVAALLMLAIVVAWVAGEF